MAFNTQSFILFVVLIGCGSTWAEMPACNVSQIETCLKEIAGDVKGDVKEMCNKYMKADECFTGLKKLCTFNDEMNKMVNETTVKIRESEEICKSVNTTCDQEMVMKCTETLEMSDGNNTVGQSKCRQLEVSLTCLMKIDGCQNNANFDELLKKGKEDMTKEKCCNKTNVERCMEFTKVVINNETVSKENCQTMAKGKSCIEEELKTCGEAEIKKIIDGEMINIDERLGVCKNNGYKIVSDGNGDGGNNAYLQQPTLIVIVSALLLGLRMI